MYFSADILFAFYVQVLCTAFNLLLKILKRY